MLLRHKKLGTRYLRYSILSLPVQILKIDDPDRVLVESRL